ncbi:MAG: hypothetical protein F6K22_09065 [Okeania sp. SIO2F4]|nr:hypothetical protein [Okeania sp. SIO2F4]
MSVAPLLSLPSRSNVGGALVAVMLIVVVAVLLSLSPSLTTTVTLRAVVSGLADVLLYSI